MCGITGLFFLNKKATSVETTRACKQLSQRGPDANSTYTDNQISLGHARLSIIDTSVTANQPMSDASGRYTLAFNGEIFNFSSLKTKYLINKNIEFQTRSDSEVLLYLLIHYGTSCLSWLDGFFALAFYDKLENSLLLARDRFGKKPLLYYHHPDFFAFASEMKALLQYDIKKEININALFHYFQFTYVPPTESILCGVNKLQPGKYLLIKGNTLEQGTYFSIAIQKDNTNAPEYPEAQKQLVQTLEKAVEKRLISDVPLGAFLSGGIDSSCVVALASRHTQHLKTFSIGYKDNPYFDETTYAKLVADKFKTSHTVFSLTSSDFLEHIDEILNYIDEPFADSSTIPLYILCKLTKAENITVALSGDGGDEIFAGYNKHFAEYQMRNPQWSNAMIKNLEPLWNMLPKGRSGFIKNKVRQLHKFSNAAKLDNKERFISMASFNQHPEKLFNDHFNQKFQTKEDNLFKQKIVADIKTNDFNEFLLADVNFVLLGDMLVKLDSMSMANSLEVRSPFLDRDVVDFAFNLPAEYKIGKKIKKKIVQDAFKEILPLELYNRPKKGFEIPLIHWLKNDLWYLVNGDLLEEDFIRNQNIFNYEYLQQLKLKIKSNDPGDTYITLWALIVFQNWYKKYFI